jgi:hypothetical protein
MNPVPRTRRPRRRDVLIATAFVGVAAALTLLAPEHVNLTKRLLGVMAGAMVVFYANTIPKALKPLATLTDPARADALQRFVGWCLVLGGLGYALAWIVVPFDYVIPVAITVLGSSLALAVGRCQWVRRFA